MYIIYLFFAFLADRTNGRTIGTVRCFVRLSSVVCRRLYVMYCG